MLIINFQAVIFYFFASVLLLAAIMAVSSRHPVRCVLFLVLAFFASSVIWMMLQVEFLALVLIFVYVGAVMTLFLFVVMMLNLDLAPKRQKWIRYLPLGILAIVAFMVLIFQFINPHTFPAKDYSAISYDNNYSNVKDLGAVLYTQYVYPFELAAVLLLVAIVAAISLVFRGRHGRKGQRINKQVAVQAKKRLRLVSLPVEKS